MNIDKIIKTMPIKPLLDRLVIVPINKEISSSIIIPEGMGKERKPREGIVVAIGKDVKELKLKDRIIFKYFQPKDIEIKGVRCFIAKEEDVYLKL
jgi:co-chaperonin GroES (HSP10)